MGVQGEHWVILKMKDSPYFGGGQLFTSFMEIDYLTVIWYAYSWATNVFRHNGDLNHDQPFLFKKLIMVVG
jgi:hypothetical protein